MATTMKTPRVPPPAADVPEGVSRAIGRWLGARRDLISKGEVLDTLHAGGVEVPAAAWTSYDDARRWEGACWAALEAAMPLRTDVSYRAGGVAVFATHADRRGTSVAAVEDGRVVRR